jgi:hypothetical protein
MVIIQQFRISDDGLRMYINLKVNDASYFKDRYITKITIMTGDKVTEATDSASPTHDFIYQEEFNPEDNLRKLDLVLTPAEMNENFTKSNFSTDLFFLFVECGGYIDGNVPCRFDEAVNTAVTFDEGLLYQKVMALTKELADTCNVSANLVDFILLYNALKASIETEHWVQAVQFYNRLVGSVKGITVKGCGCHG